MLKSIVGVEREQNEGEKYDLELMYTRVQQKTGILGLNKIIETPSKVSIKCEV